MAPDLKVSYTEALIHYSSKKLAPDINASYTEALIQNCNQEVQPVILYCDKIWFIHQITDGNLSDFFVNKKSFESYWKWWGPCDCLYYESEVNFLCGRYVCIISIRIASVIQPQEHPFQKEGSVPPSRTSFFIRYCIYAKEVLKSLLTGVFFTYYI